jgi:hypothetical protein
MDLLHVILNKCGQKFFKLKEAGGMAQALALLSRSPELQL